MRESDGYYCSYNSRGITEYVAGSRLTALIPKQVIEDNTPYDKAFAANFNELSYRAEGGALLIDEKIANRLNGNWQPSTLRVIVLLLIGAIRN